MCFIVWCTVLVEVYLYACNDWIGCLIGELDLILFISVPFRPFRPFFLFFYHLNGQPFNFRLPPKQNSLPPFTVYWPFRRTLCPTINTIAVLLLVLLVVVFFYVLNPWYYVLLCILMY